MGCRLPENRVVCSALSRVTRLGFIHTVQEDVDVAVLQLARVEVGRERVEHGTSRNDHTYIAL